MRAVIFQFFPIQVFLNKALKLTKGDRNYVGKSEDFLRKFIFNSLNFNKRINLRQLFHCVENVADQVCFEFDKFDSDEKNKFLDIVDINPHKIK